MSWLSRNEQPKQDREEAFPVEHVKTLEEIERDCFEAMREDMNHANPHLPQIDMTFEEFKSVKPTRR